MCHQKKYVKLNGNEMRFIEVAVNFSVMVPQQLRLFHWQTRKYSIHLAIDKTLDVLIPLTIG